MFGRRIQSGSKPPHSITRRNFGRADDARRLAVRANLLSIQRRARSDAPYLAHDLTCLHFKM
jgi:hypothetical protein